MAKQNYMWILVGLAIIAIIIIGPQFGLFAVQPSIIKTGIEQKITSQEGQIATLFDYKIVSGMRTISPRSYPIYVPPLACESNTCNGVADRIDENGCQIWKSTALYSVGSCTVQSNAYYHRTCSFSPSCPGGTITMKCIDDTPNGCYKCFNYGAESGGYFGKCTATAYCNAPVYCGGIKPTLRENYVGCPYKTKIYYKGNLIWDINFGISDYTTGTRRVIFKDGIAYQQVGSVDTGAWYKIENGFKSTPIDSPPIEYDFKIHTGGYVTDEDNDCESVSINTYIYIPEMTYDIDSELTYFTGQDAYLYLVINQSWRDDLFGNLSIIYTLDTAIGRISDTISQEVKIKKGENIIPVKIPTIQVTEKIKIKPSLELKIPNIIGTGLNVLSGCYPYSPTARQIEQCTQGIAFGIINFDEKEVQIAPRPLFMDIPAEGCPIGYEINADKTYCIRNDIKNLTCFQIGCPILTGHSYECTSAGICAEVVFVYKDCTTEGCPAMGGAEAECLSSGICRYINETTKEIIVEKRITCADNPSFCPSGTTCDVQAQVCIKSEIYKDIIQCSTDNDCLSPCQGIAVKCENNRCYYSGECVSREIDCKDVGCPDGYSCTQEGVCIKTETLKLACGSLGCSPGFTCNTKTGNCEKIEYQSRNCQDVGCPDGYSCNIDRGVCIKEELPFGVSKNMFWMILIILIIIAYYIFFEKGHQKGFIRR